MAATRTRSALVFYALREYRPFAPDNRTSNLMAKRGHKSNLSVGVTNEIAAVQRTRRRDYSGDKRWQYLLTGWSCTFPAMWDSIDPSNQIPVFSSTRDSGSCVFDSQRRVVGLIDSGDQSYRVVRILGKEGEKTKETLQGRREGRRHSEGKPGDWQKVEEDHKDPEARDLLTGQAVKNVTPDMTFVTMILESIRKFTGMEVEIIIVQYVGIG